MSLRKSKHILNTLSGVVCVYKPPDVTAKYIRKSFADKLCKELNESHVRPPFNYLEIYYNQSAISVDIRPSYEDNVLANGPRYITEDLCLALSPIWKRTSGVCIIGINEGINYMNKLRQSNPLKVLQIKGMFGQATQNLYKNEKVVAKASYKRINRQTMDKIISSVQAAHQRKIFVELGVDIQSQEAYELAVQGILRPIKQDFPCIYSIKCIDFKPPCFTLEIACVNENEDYLLRFIHDLGLQLKTLAHCTGIRCIRYGPFTVENALITQQWTLSNVVDNIIVSKELIIRSDAIKYSQHLRKISETEECKQEIPRSENRFF